MKKMYLTVLLCAAIVPSAWSAVLPAVGSGQLVVQLDAGLGVTISGSTVTSWVDQSATTVSGLDYGGTFTNTSGPVGSTPTLVLNALQGQPVIRFNGIDYLRSTLASTGAGSQDTVLDYTLFFVTAGNTNPRGLFDSAPGVAGPLRFHNNNRVANQDDDGAGIPVTLTPGLSSGATILTVYHDGTNAADGPKPANSRRWEGYVNGLSYAGSSVQYVAGSGRRTAWGFSQIGAYNNNDANFTGDIAEILVYTGNLSTTDRQSVESYLSIKYLPEPSSLALLGLAGAMLAARRRA